MKQLTDNKYILTWIQYIESIVTPENIVWIDGSDEQLEKLRRQACESGEIIKLNEEKHPGCYLHRSAQNDVARAEKKTFICTKTQLEAGPTNNWMRPDLAYKKLYKIAKNSYKNKTMYVIPYSMGLLDSSFCKLGVELTDSIYTVLNMAIMTRVGMEALNKIGQGDNWVRGLHCSCNIDEDKRYVCHFPQDKTIISVNSGYGGNVLLGKKCFALRIASEMARKENWLAEHMLILGIEKPNGEVKYVCAAFPSACGKTNLAMLIPPEIYTKAGYKIWCVGDDIAWLRIGEDGRLWAMNPENGFFGVAPGTSAKSNPNALASTSKNTIFTNVVHNLDDNTVWWEGLNDNPPENAVDWKGNPWNGKKSSEKGAHPNSRFTAPASNCPYLSPEFYNPIGVPISAIIFGGRRANTIPLVYETKNWNHGVFTGSTISSETTAAITGQVGVLRNDPMAMISFCGYNMGWYFNHWLKMGKLLGENAPKIFAVNWFRKDKDGSIIWPGYGENIRILEWILKRCEGRIGAIESPIGYLPRSTDIRVTQTDVSLNDIKKLLHISKPEWRKEVNRIRKFYKMFGDELPEELLKELDELENDLKLEQD